MCRAIAFVCVAAVYVIPAAGQTDLTMFGGFNFPSGTITFSHPPWPLGEYWKSGYSMGLAFRQRLYRGITLVPSCEYAAYAFDKKASGFVIPEGPPPVYSGETSRMYRISLEANITAIQSRRFDFFIATGAVYVYERMGSIFNQALSYSGYSVIAYAYPARTYVAHTLGIGADLFLSDRIGLEVAAKYFSNYTDRFHSSLTLGLIYRLSLVPQ